MAGTTTNYNFHTWNENDYVNWEDINENFETIDDMFLCISKSTKSSTYKVGTGADQLVSWECKQYPNNVIEMDCVLSFLSLYSNNGSAPPYYSESVSVNFPSDYNFSQIKNISINMSSDSIGWPVDMSASDDFTKVIFSVLAIAIESTEVNKRVYIKVKGVLDDA